MQGEAEFSVSSRLVRSLRLLALPMTAVLLLGLAACGQKGPLTLPSATAPASAASAGGR